MANMEPILPEDRWSWQLDRLLELCRTLDREQFLEELARTAKALTSSWEGRVVVSKEAGEGGGVDDSSRRHGALRLEAAERAADSGRQDSPHRPSGSPPPNSSHLGEDGRGPLVLPSASAGVEERAGGEKRLIPATHVAGTDERDLPPTLRSGDGSQMSHSSRYDFLSFPIMVEGAEAGALVVWSKGDGGKYSEEDRKMTELLAGQAGVALGFIRLKEERQKWLERMAQLDSQKSSFIAIASHELRTPLGLILGYSTYLREVLRKAEEGSPGDGEASTTHVVDAADAGLKPARHGTPPWQEELDTIVSSAMRLKEIIDTLAGSNNVERGLALVRRGEVPLKEVIKEALEGVREEAKRKKIRLKSELGKGSLRVEGDRAKVRQALGNLVQNAVTYTEAGGHVTVRVEEIQRWSTSRAGGAASVSPPQSPHFSEIGGGGGSGDSGRRGETLQPDTAVRVMVSDDGIGIPAKDLEHIFERFYQVEGHLSRKHGGMGLGLSMAKEIVELHGGRMWAESEAGMGSRFFFELPVKMEGHEEEDLRDAARGLLEM